jgi:hypothetical protein
VKEIEDEREETGCKLAAHFNTRTKKFYEIDK